MRVEPDPYNTPPIKRGDQYYQYDPDFDIYRPVRTEPLTWGEKWGWVIVSMVCLLFAWVMVYLGH
jgi:hypothetical protein